MSCLRRNSDITGYRIRYGRTHGPWITRGAAVEEGVANIEGTAPENRQFTITGLLPRMLYNVYVTAVNSIDDEGPPAHITEETGVPDGK